MEKKINTENKAFQSSIGTKITIDSSESEIVITKKTKLNKSFYEDADFLISLINRYSEMLSGAEIDIPVTYEIYCENHSIITKSDYAGEGILEMMKSNKLESTIVETDIFYQIITILKSIKISKIDFDPLPKNYVLQNGRLSYVDLTPPWLPEYYELRLKKANEDEKKVLTDFFGCMHYKEMGFHLAGDLVKIDEKNVDHMPLIHKTMRKEGLIDSSYDYFKSKYESIIQKERLREDENIFLM